MKVLFTFSIAAMLLSLFTLQSQAQPIAEEQIIAYAKKIDVSQLDSTLPSQSFAHWFRKTVGSAAKITWEVNDCGEQTGRKSDLERDIPICVQAEADLKEGGKVVVMIAVGTLRRGLTKELEGIYYSVYEEGGETYNLKHLRDLPKTLNAKNRNK
jgi:hypothetical protein